MVDLTEPSPAPPSDLVGRLRAAGCVFAEEEAGLLAAQATGPELAALVRRRVAGEPLEHVLGWARFCGLRIRVDPGVFVPRRRTELLVREAVRRAAPGAVVVELCCGSGAVAAALLHLRPDLDLYAVDVDPAAVRCARRNLPGDRVLEGDLYSPLPRRLRGSVDLVVVNAPYVPTGEIPLMPAEAREHEAPVALDGGTDGLDIQRRVAADARAWLRPAGHLLVETSTRQGRATSEAFSRNRLTAELVVDEDVGGTVAVGQAPVARTDRFRGGA